MAAFAPRAVVDADWPKMVRLDATSFGHVVHPSGLAAWRTIIPEGGALVIEDGPDVIAQSAFLDLALTVPGGAVLPVGGISWVSVAPTHRRRGLLRTMLTELHRRIGAAQYPIAALTASEGGIYGRFGYGPATVVQNWSVDRRRAQFRSDAPHPGGVRIVTPAEHVDDFAAIYDRWRLATPGGLARPRALWDDELADREEARDGGTALFALLHRDGYVLYRAHGSDARYIRVVDFTAVTPDAHVALWRTLCGLDLMERIEIGTCPGDPLPYLLTDARTVRTTAAADDLWLRLMDVPAALQARTYRHDLSAVLEVSDGAGAAGGRFAVRIRDGRAECRPTDAAPDLECDLDVLGSLYLGGHRASHFAAANRLRGKDTDLIAALDTAFLSDVPAQLGFQF